MEKSDKDHPVWCVYDEYRTSRLNVKYLEIQLHSLKMWNQVIELILAISASSSVAGMWFWENLFGGYLWKTIGSIAASSYLTTNEIKRSRPFWDSLNLLWLKFRTPNGGSVNIITLRLLI